MNPYRNHIPSPLFDGPEILGFSYNQSCPYCNISVPWYNYPDGWALNLTYTCWYGHKDRPESDCAKKLKASHLHYKCRCCNREFRMLLCDLTIEDFMKGQSK